MNKKIGRKESSLLGAQSTASRLNRASLNIHHISDLAKMAQKVKGTEKEARAGHIHTDTHT